jgi:acetylserotonin N-methyltransferase
MTTSPNAPPDIVLDLIESFRRSKTMFAAVSLGVFDRLAEGPATAAALAGADNPDSMKRLLDACVSLGLLRRQGDLYSNTEVAARYICRNSPDTLAGYIRYSNQVLYPLWGNLEDAVREGAHRWKQTFGLEGPLFSHFFRTEEAKRDFLSGMHGFGRLSSPKVVRAFDLGRFSRLVDLGGATGHLAMAAAEAWPELKCAIFDLPEVIAVAREFTAGADVELIEGDFFHDPLPPADLYALGRILHDWSEEKIGVLLKRIYESLPAGGALLVAEKLLDEDMCGPVHAHMQSLNMLVCTEGRERSLSQYAELLRDYGFRDVQGQRTGAPLDAILATK